MEPVGIEPTSKRPPNQTLNYTFTCSILRSPSLEQEQWGVKCWNSPSRLKTSRNELLCCHESPNCDLTIPLYFVVLIRADDLRGTSPQQNSVYKDDFKRNFLQLF